MESRKKGRKVALVAGLALVVLSVGMVWTYWKEIRFFLMLERLGKNEQGRPEYRHRQTGIVFVGLPGGTFEMGTSREEVERIVDEGGKGHHQYRKQLQDQIAREHPSARVTLSPFLIAKYEVTQEEWRRVMGYNPSDEIGDALPVVNVSWDDCQEFCRKAGLSLPTEAQWEYACRAGTSGPFGGTGKLAEMGWCDGNSDGTHPIGQKFPNDFGLHDMHGNVVEWCEDWFQEDFYRESNDAIDPWCENSGSGDRVNRGGCWGNDAVFCRSAFRFGNPPFDRRDFVGFRPAWSSP